MRGRFLVVFWPLYMTVVQLSLSLFNKRAHASLFNLFIYNSAQRLGSKGVGVDRDIRIVWHPGITKIRTITLVLNTRLLCICKSGTILFQVCSIGFWNFYRAARDWWVPFG